MANDHFISQFLTKWWEVQPGRMLHYFDFETASFDVESSEHLFADRGLHTTETGERLNRLVEQPFAQHLRVLESNPRANVPFPKSWRTFRAFAALWWLQPQRTSDATTPGELGMSLDQLLTYEEGAIDAIGKRTLDNFLMFVVRANVRERLFFTQAGSFLIPVGNELSLALPLSPHHFLTLVRKTVHAPEAALQKVLDVESMLSGLSIGVGSKVHRVVLPPEMVPTNDAERAQCRQGLLMLRTASRRIIDLLGEANEIVGLSTWHVT